MIVTYADFKYYQTEYMGNQIERSDFQRLALRASDYIDSITMGRAAECVDTPGVKKACCALAETYQIIEKAQTRAASGEQGLKSQTVGSWSKTYESDEIIMRQYSTQLRNVAERYLYPTGLLYRGGNRCFRTL